VPKPSCPKAKRRAVGGDHNQRGPECMLEQGCLGLPPWDQLSLSGVVHPFCCALMERSCLQPSSCTCQRCSQKSVFWLFLGQTTCITGTPSGLPTSKLSCSFPVIVSVYISQGCNAFKMLCSCVVTIIEKPLKRRVITPF